MTSKMLAVLAVAALALTALAAPAGAAKKASKSQLAAITKAIHATPVGDANKLPQSWYRVTGAKVSSLSGSWAWASEAATKAGEGKFQPAFFLLVRPAGLKTWVVVDLGTAMVGCGFAPNSVLADLQGISGDPCPDGSGISGS
jgi:hypothetical protein